MPFWYVKRTEPALWLEIFLPVPSTASSGLPTNKLCGSMAKSMNCSMFLYPSFLLLLFALEPVWKGLFAQMGNLAFNKKRGDSYVMWMAVSKWRILPL